MRKKMDRRDFVLTGAAVAGLAGVRPRPAFGRAPAIQTSSVKPLVIASANGYGPKNGGSIDLCREGVRHDHEWSRRAGRLDCWRQHRGARPDGWGASGMGARRTRTVWSSSIRAACMDRRSTPVVLPHSRE